MFPKVFRLSLLLSCMVAADVAHAAYQFTFADSSGTPLSLFTVNLGDTVQVRVYLTDDSGTLPSQGLGSINFEVTSDDPSVADVAGLADVLPNPDFFLDPLFSDISVTTGLVSLDLTYDPAAVPATGGAFLATLVYTPGVVGVTTIEATLLGNGYTGQANPIDPVLLASGTITVSEAAVVPEPGSFLVFGGLLGTGGLCIVRRRRKAA